MNGFARKKKGTQKWPIEANAASLFECKRNKSRFMIFPRMIPLQASSSPIDYDVPVQFTMMVNLIIIS